MHSNLCSDFLSGSVFGAALLTAGVYVPTVIKSQLQFTSFHMLETMLGASASTALVFQIADRLKIMPLQSRTPSEFGLFHYDGNIVGGALIGIGMAVTGACPGTVLVQLSNGFRAGFLVALGGVIGGMVFVALRPSLQSLRGAQGKRKSESTPDGALDVPQGSKIDTVPASLGLDPIILLLVWVPLCALLVRTFVVFGYQHPATRQASFISPAYSGLLIGAAQAFSVLLRRRTIGVSTAYEDTGRWILQWSNKGRDSDIQRPSLLTPAVMFATGIAVGSGILGYCFSSIGASSSGALGVREASNALLGGMLMVFGARVAGGCTSGHAISGLATFSWSSVATTAAMFISGAALSQVVA